MGPYLSHRILPTSTVSLLDYYTLGIVQTISVPAAAWEHFLVVVEVFVSGLVSSSLLPHGWMSMRTSPSVLAAAVVALVLFSPAWNIGRFSTSRF